MKSTYVILMGLMVVNGVVSAVDLDFGDASIFFTLALLLLNVSK